MVIRSHLSLQSLKLLQVTEESNLTALLLAGGVRPLTRATRRAISYPHASLS